MARAGAHQTLRMASALLALMLCGCAALPVQNSGMPPPMPLLSAESLGASHHERQLVRAAFADQEASMQCLVDITPTRMSVIALNAMGLRLFSITIEGDQTTVERSLGVPEQIQPERILGDIQLAYWPLEKLRQSFRGTDWEITEPYPSTRRLKRAGRLIAEVHYTTAGKDLWQVPLWLANYEFGYSLSVSPLPKEQD